MSPAEPGDEQRAGGVPVRGTEADVPQADPALQPGAARPGALHLLRSVHPVRGADRGGPVHRAVG